MLFHPDFPAFVNTNQIATLALDLVSLSDAKVLNDAALPAAQQFPFSNLLILEYLLLTFSTFYN